MKITRIGGIVAVLIALVVLIGCGPARAIYGASLGMNEAITIKRDIAQQGDLSKEDERVITKGMLDANSALIQVTDTAKCFTEFTTDVKQNVLRSLDVTVTSLDNLNQSGTLHIKNEKARERFRQKIFYARLAASGIRATIALLPAKDPSDNSQPALTEQQQRDLKELRALCEKAGVQLRQNESMLIDDLARLDGRNPEK